MNIRPHDLHPNNYHEYISELVDNDRKNDGEIFVKYASRPQWPAQKERQARLQKLIAEQR